MSYKNWIANAFSSLNLIFGVLSIIAATERNFFLAAIFILAAVVADSLDGRVARALGVSGDFGKELDSLCDVCSFGVAPGILIYQYAMLDLGWTGKVIAALFAVFGALRLARFNVNAASVHGYFVGMPIPGGGSVIATYCLSGFAVSPLITAIGTLLIAFIMYSEIKFPDFKGQGNPIKLFPFILALACGLYLLYINISAWPFVIMFTYTLTGVFNAIYVRFRL